MRRAAACCLAAALGVGGLTACGSGTGAAGSESFERSDAAKLILGPKDLGRGYAIGDDSGCGQISPEGSSERFATFVLAARPEACANEINHIWGGFRTTVVPRSVESTVAVFDSDADARRGMELRGELIRFLVGESPREFEELEEFGHDALGFGNGGYDVPPGAGVIWRNGNALAVVFAGGLGMTAERASKEALELARKQQERIEHPEEKQTEQRMDPELPLDDPTLDVPVWWLGRTFDPGGDLPALTFASAHAGTGDGELGFSLELDYGAAGRDTWGVKLWVFRPDAFEVWKRGVLADMVAGVPCASSTKLELAGGQAVIWEGFAKPTGPPCPSRPHDRFVAYVYVKGAVVTVNQPWCLYPCSSPLTGTPDPYNTARGLAAVAKGLQVREPRSE